MPAPPSPSLTSTPPLQLHELTHTASDARLHAILTLSTRIFSAISIPSDPNTHTSFVYWRQRLDLPGANIQVVMRSEEPLGFVFNVPKRMEEVGDGDEEVLHVWLAGVVEEARGLGVLRMLLTRTVSVARERGVQWLTVRTVPSVFGRMFAVLKGAGWEEVSWKDGVTGRSVLMRLRVT